MSLSAKVFAAIDAALDGANDLGAVKFTLEETSKIQHAFDSGTGSNQADKLFADQRTLSASASENLDLAGSLTDPFGVTVSFAKVKALFIRAASGNSNDVVVGGAASNAFLGPFGDATDTVKVPPKGCFLALAPGSGWTVTAGTGDILKVANGGAASAVTYDIIVIGTSA